MTFRGRTRVLQSLLAAGMALAAGYAASGPDDLTLWWQLGAAVAAAFLVFAAVRFYQRGISADARGMVVRNLVTTRRIPWEQVQAIDYDAVKSQGGWTSYHRLVIITVPGGRFVAESPGGNRRPGGFLSNVRDKLLSMRDAAMARGTSPRRSSGDAAAGD